MKAYLVLLIATSGQPLQTVATLPWNEDLEEQVFRKNTTRQKFRNIKYRAYGREITFEVGMRHLPLLRTYLKLRKYLLQGKNSEHLFFNYGKNESSEAPSAIASGSQVFVKFYHALLRLDPSLKTVTSREFRVAKGDFLIGITDIATAAVIMQHSLETSRTSYNNGSQTKQFVELSSFLKAVENRVKNSARTEAKESSEERAAGGCGMPASPRPLLEHPPAMPDCRNPDGCFFCENYYAHADELDARKLLSARLCITYRASRATDLHATKALYEPVLKVIEMLINGIKHHDPEMVAEIERQVEQDNALTPYWMAKLQVLMELEGLIL